MPRRHRPTELVRETQRRSSTLAIGLGEQVRAERQRHHTSQAALATAIGRSQTEISRLERGLGATASLETWIAVGIAIDRPLAVSLSRALGRRNGEPTDVGHLEIQEYLLHLAASTGRRGTFELPTRPTDPMRSTDVGIRDSRHATRILAECWNTFGDLGAAIRSTHRKIAEASATWPLEHVASVWVVRASATNRRLIDRYPHIIDAAFPGSSRAWVGALTDSESLPPERPGFVWFDRSTRRLIERRRRSVLLRDR